MDVQYMSRALELARKGGGGTSPNPLVGAVIVKDGRIIGEGFYERYGDPHAAISAIYNASEDVRGAVMYTTLEPCAKYSKTPPCVNEIAKHGIRKVVIGMVDVKPHGAGKGIERLKLNGITVEVGVLEEECRRLNEVYIHYVTTGMPFCMMKTAMTRDGRIAACEGDFKWITSDLSKEFIHRLRNRISAVMVGVGTVIRDDPQLTARLESCETRDPVRIIADSRGRTPPGAQVLKGGSNAKTIIASTELADSGKLKDLEAAGAEIILCPLKEERVDLYWLVRELARRKIDSILFEGGCTLNFSAMNEGIINKVISFIVPKIYGSDSYKEVGGGTVRAAVRDSILLRNIEVHRFGEDIMIEGYLRKEP